MVTHKLEGRGMQNVIKIGGSWFASLSSTKMLSFHLKTSTIGLHLIFEGL